MHSPPSNWPVEIGSLRQVLVKMIGLSGLNKRQRTLSSVGERSLIGPSISECRKQNQEWDLSISNNLQDFWECSQPLEYNIN